MHARRSISILLAALAMGGGLAACSENEAEDAGRDAGGAVQDAGESAGDAAQDAGNEIEENT